MELLRLLLLLVFFRPTRGQGFTMAHIVCVVKETCLIPCSFSIKDDLQGIDWIQTNTRLLVHSFSNGKDQLGNQDRAFKSRTSMFPEQILRGNGSLQLSHVKLKDQGTYVCRVFTSGSNAYNWVEIKVEGPVRAVTLEQRGDVLVCSSENLYPRPSVIWSPHSEQQTQIEPTEDQLFSISSSLPLELTAPQSYSCNISTPTSWKSATYSLHPPIEMSPTISIPCVDSVVPEKSLEWTFNYIQTIVTRTGAEETVADPWRKFVEHVSESGSLSLKDLSSKQDGVFVCEVRTDHITYISQTQVGNEDASPVGFIVVFVLVILVLVIVIVVLWKKGFLWKCLRRLGIVKKHQSKVKNWQDKESKLLMKKLEKQTLKLQTTLQDIFDVLSEDELQKVKSLLMDQSFMEEFPAITEHELDEEEDITKVMVKAYDVHSFTIAKTVLQKLKRNDLMEKLSDWKDDPEDITEKCMKDIKRRLSKKFNFLPEGTIDYSEKKREKFTEGYIELLITERDFAQKENSTKERTFQCQDIFRGHAQNSEPIRTVLTEGVAGVGKTVLTQKFSLDWAEDRANHDVQLLFPFTFRELNVLKGAHFSLVGLIHHFFSETKHLWSFQHLQLMFIFDGVYECRLPLDFSRTRVLHQDTESGTVEELLVNLIKGNLLPSARLWITTRPAAASQIPPMFVSIVTEVRGFTDQQKEQYFRKRFRDEQQAKDVISHIKSNRSLGIMSNIPIFCWILSVILSEMKTPDKEQPVTLTQMYIYLLLSQTKIDRIKDNVDSRIELHNTLGSEMVQSLGKLAFEHLQRGNFVFKKRDLRTYGLDTADISCYSRIITQVFTEESDVDRDKGYSFVHLSVQEFLAAFHVHQTFNRSKQNLLVPRSSKTNDSKAFYCSIVDKTLENPNGHMDLFICFLLGLSLPNNQKLLSGLLTRTKIDLTASQETIKYIHDKLNKKGLSAKRGLNLLHCLNELNDHSLVEKIQEFMRKRRQSDLISPAEWSALSSLLLSSHFDQQEFDLRNYFPTEKGLLGLLPIIKVSTKVILSSCGLSKTSCGSHALASVLVSSSLTHLDLSNNDLQDSGVEQLYEGLKSTSCGLETLNLSLCGLSSLSCDPLALVLVSSNLAHLDLSNNDLQDSGVETLFKRLKGTTCRLETLKLSGCLISETGGSSLAAVLSSSFNQLQELDLSYNHLGASAEQLTSLPYNHSCTVRVKPCGEKFMVLGLRKYACELSMDSNTAHKDLSLSENNRTVTFKTKEQLDSDHEDRFTHWCQVLSSTGLRGRCYWEVDWSGEKVDIAVSYKRIKRKGNKEECAFGGNDHSWSLLIWEGHCAAVYENKKTILPGRVGVSTEKHSDQVDWSFVKPGVPAGGAGMSEDKDQSSVGMSLLTVPARVKREGSFSDKVREFSGRVAVFLDFDAGVLSFYDVTSDGNNGNQRRHIHTFSSSFTEPLYPGFGVDSGSSVSVVDLMPLDQKQELIHF